MGCGGVGILSGRLLELRGFRAAATTIGCPLLFASIGESARPFAALENGVGGAALVTHPRSRRLDRRQVRERLAGFICPRAGNGNAFQFGIWKRQAAWGDDTCSGERLPAINLRDRCLPAAWPSNGCCRGFFSEDYPKMFSWSSAVTDKLHRYCRARFRFAGISF